MNLLNNREIAFALWLIVVAIYLVSSSKMKDARRSFIKLMSAFLSRQIISVLTLLAIYMGVVIYLMSEADLWNIGQIKNTAFWAVAVGFMSLLKLEEIKSDKRFFRRSVTDSFKILAVMQFVAGVYPSFRT